MHPTSQIEHVSFRTNGNDARYSPGEAEEIVHPRQLCGVFMKSGGQLGGHWWYLARISGQWFCCDDARVERLGNFAEVAAHVRSAYSVGGAPYALLFEPVLESVQADSGARGASPSMMEEESREPEVEKDGGLFGAINLRARDVYQQACGIAPVGGREQGEAGATAQAQDTESGSCSEPSELLRRGTGTGKGAFQRRRVLEAIQSTLREKPTHHRKKGSTGPPLVREGEQLTAVDGSPLDPLLVSDIMRHAVITYTGPDGGPYDGVRACNPSGGIAAKHSNGESVVQHIARCFGANWRRHVGEVKPGAWDQGGT